MDQDHPNLDDELGFEPPAGDDPEPEPIVLDGAAEANRMLRRLRASEREAADVLEVAAADIAQVQAWRDKRLESITRTASWARRSLEGWIRAVHDQTGKQSVKLPAGTVALRKAQPRLDLPEVTTAEQAAAWNALAASASTDEVTFDPPVTTTYKIAKRAAGAFLLPGEPVGEVDPDGYQAHHAVTADGEPVPDTIVHMPTRLGFSAKPAAAIEDLEADLEP